MLRKNRIDRSDTTIPQTTTTSIFRVVGGRVKIRMYGEVTTVIQTQANAMKLTANPTVGADVDMCATLDISAHAVGTMYNLPGDQSDALEYQASGAMESIGDYQEQIVAPGTIDLVCAASNTGAIKWVITYEPIDRHARIVRV